MRASQAREEICRVGKSLFERGYVHATAGNISVRLEESDGGGFLITPTDACLGFLDPASLAHVDQHLNQLSGDKASKTIALHHRIYAESRMFDADVSCVIHTHSTHCVALSLRSSQTELLAPITPYFVMKVGHVPLIPYHRPGDLNAAALVAKAIAAYGQAGCPIRAVMLSRLGPNVWHNSPSTAMATLEELEETARLVCLTRESLPGLSESQIEELRVGFAARW